MDKESFETMLDVLDAKQIAKALQISKVGAYNLLNSEDFHTLRMNAGERQVFMSKNTALLNVCLYGKIQYWINLHKPLLRRKSAHNKILV